MADNALAKMAQMRATPRNKLMGLLADSLGGVRDYANAPDPTMPGGLANPPLSMLSNLLSLPSLATTAQRASYGEPLTNAGKANVPFLKPETADAMMMAPLSPRMALGALGLAGGMADTGAMRAATVWHGSPHKFDKFDASKIGTGEGAQAYGHGLYLAGAPDVAGSYAKTLSNIGADGYATAHLNAQTQVQRFGNDPEWALEVLTDTLGRAEPYQQKAIQATIDMVKSGAYKKPLANAGNLYKVDLPDQHIAKMLDWDKPLSQQAPEVQAAIERLKPSMSPSWQKAINGKTTGESLHIAVGSATNNTADAATRLRDAGIPGIRYLDGGSRGAGQGSSNYVIFPQNENILSILERNGQPVGK